jgi:biotin operon repressor
MEATDQVLDEMKAAGKPVGGGEVATITGLARKVVDKAMDALKKTGAIESPVRCKWQPKA